MSKPSNLAQDLVTVEQFDRLVPDGQKADLIDEVIDVNVYECLQGLLRSSGE